MKVKLEHARRLHYCSSGIRQFCSKYNIDFRDFIRNGIDAKELEKLDDGLSNRMINLAKEDSLNGK